MHDHPVREKYQRKEILEILLNGQIDLEGQFILGSNYTFLVNITLQERSLKAVYKPMKGEVPLWDFPSESLAAREAAAFLVSESLGWELVPPTAIRDDGPFGAGSVQLFIPHDPDNNYFSFDTDTLQRLRETVLFDMLINNADRKGSHIILDENEHIWLIDHGLCFHKLPKLRTVIWNFASETIGEHLLKDLEKLLEILRSENTTEKELSGLLTIEEIDAIKSRILFIIKHPVFPSPEKDKRQFPWPPV